MAENFSNVVSFVRSYTGLVTLDLERNLQIGLDLSRFHFALVNERFHSKSRLLSVSFGFILASVVSVAYLQLKHHLI